jgi:hypothetical protein
MPLKDDIFIRLQTYLNNYKFSNYYSVKSRIFLGKSNPKYQNITIIAV